ELAAGILWPTVPTTRTQATGTRAGSGQGKRRKVEAVEHGGIGYAEAERKSMAGNVATRGHGSDSGHAASQEPLQNAGNTVTSPYQRDRGMGLRAILVMSGPSSK